MSQEEDLSCNYPAIDKALAILRARHLENGSRIGKYASSISATRLVVPENISRRLPLYKRALIIADKIEQTCKPTQRQQLGESTVVVDNYSLLRIAFKSWKTQSKLWKTTQQEVYLRLQQLLSADRRKQIFSPSMQERCVQRFGKCRLARLHYHWVLKRTAFAVLLYIEKRRLKLG